MKNGFFSNGFVRTGMIDLFAKCSAFWNALRMFDEVSSSENVVCWHAIISAAFRMPNSFTFSSVLTACAALKEAEIECGDMDEAVKTFSWMPTRNVVSWTAIISGFVFVLKK
ncbi:hypothetical protein V6N13_096604 [Hibiscus sabdariffa]